MQVYFATTTISIEHVRTGKLRALAVTTAKRSEVRFVAALGDERT